MNPVRTCLIASMGNEMSCVAVVRLVVRLSLFWLPRTASVCVSCSPLPDAAEPFCAFLAASAVAHCDGPSTVNAQRL